MSKDKKEEQKSKSLKTTLKNDWTINYNNTSDIGYPDGEFYDKVEEED